MISKGPAENLIEKKELLKDYIDFLLVILLSFFIKYDAKEVVLSVWFYSVIMTYLFVFLCIIYSNHVDSLGVIKKIVGISCLFCLQFCLIKDYFDEKATIGSCISFVPFLPFVVYKYRDYFEPKKVVSKMDLLVYKTLFFCKTQLLTIVSVFLGVVLQDNHRICFFVVYTLFFFPFIKTFEFFKQKKGEIK